MDAQKEYIRNFMHYFESVLRSDEFDNPQTGYASVIDVESFIDYLIINEVSKNMDGYRLSTFMYKDRDDNNGKLHIGPVWDYNLAYGNYTYCGADLSSGLSLDFTGVCPGDGYKVPFWWDRLLQDENFTLQLRERYDALRETHLHIDSIFSDIDSLVNHTTEARIRNYTVWQEVFTSPVWPIEIPWAEDYDGEIEYMKSWINQRFGWLDDYLGETRERKYYISIANPETEEYISIGAYPNPFQEEVTISIELDQPHSVSIDIYNLNGQRISRLANRNFSEGYHEISWDGLDRTGMISSPGVYIYTVTIDNAEHHTGKLIRR